MMGFTSIKQMLLFYTLGMLAVTPCLVLLSVIKNIPTTSYTVQLASVDSQGEEYCNFTLGIERQ